MSRKTITYTECYYRSHSKEPRGRGYWIFVGPYNFKHAANGTLAEARKAAIAAYRASYGEAPHYLDVQP